MPVETERKYRLNQTEAARIAAKLFEVNADFVGETEEENIIFAGRPLSGKRAVVRIRRMPNVAILTYKRAIDGDQDFKQHIEIETGIEDADATEQILKELGLKRALVYEKRRKCWRLKDVEVVIDRLPFGEFLEIEGAVAGIIEAEKILGAENLEYVRATYPRLTAAFGIEKDGVIEARFTDNYGGSSKRSS
ncbi:MAG: class IV adenylate cyclase [Blastocatellia bacterium]